MKEHTYDNSQDPTCNVCEFSRYKDFYDYISYGACGQNVDWVLQNDGTLLIVGSGSMHDYPKLDGLQPWSQYADQIKGIRIEPGVTTICKTAFYKGSTYHYNNLKSVSIPDSISSIGDTAFSGCQSIERIIIPGDGVNIGTYAFFACDNLKEITISGDDVIIGANAFALHGDSTNAGRTIHFEGDVPQIADDAFMYVVANAYYPPDNSTWTDSVMKDYGGTITWIPYCSGEHKEETIPSQEATCIETGLTEGKKCSVCGMVTVAQKIIPVTAHSYDDNVDGTCNVCSVNRETVETRQVTHMFRMYNPNTGEHFYTGSEVEKQNLVDVGWQYEGVGFTFPANTGAPVYRLFEPATGEHLYTMDEEEKAKLESEGWNYEGIAFNSAYDTEAVQHRLYNPNATVGAYHFTFSEEEINNLIFAGWEYQGIGWYSCWK